MGGRFDGGDGGDLSGVRLWWWEMVLWVEIEVVVMEKLGWRW